ncbi:SpaA isopeptide-forming pilin-related protein [Pediococcus pentosaceus]|uniref:SpaA isopeptide-forming pilin-related protein n=1 Tax=Pediococcus pentosaceus TaxID=1255 RepID=UPI0003C336E2|nr:SpaA isopeptide-forming pilin-related protein [Pediococcus pentosaceus]AHA04338.1 surface protein from Gram-positive cocci [Pediococcus pentosaceus SL4]
MQQNDFTAINNIRVLKATSSNSSGWPEGFKNVTSTYASSISVSDNTFNVDLGDSLKDGSSFVIEYAVAADKGQTQASYGVKKNNASFTHTDIDGTSGVNNTSANQAIDDNSNGSFTLNKDVKQTQYISGSKYLDYTITIKNNKNFNIPSGSKIEDSLVEGLSYVSTNSNSSNVDLTPDVNGNSVSWRINKELVSGESAVVHFRVKVDENKFKSGDKIDNTAVLHRQGSKDLTSNTSSVYTYNGKIKIIKTDADTGSKLAGAEFDFLDENGKVVDHLTTNKNGTITSKILPAGVYKVVETKAPDGYKLSKEKYTVHLDYSHADKGIVDVNITDKADTTDTTSTTDTSDTTDTTSTTDTSDTTDTTSTTDTSDTTDTTSTTDTSDTTDTTSTTDTSDTTDTTSTTDTSDTTDTTSTTDTSDTTDTTSTTDTSDTTDTTSTTDTSDTTDSTSTTNTSDTTDTTSTTNTSDTTDSTSTTNTSDTTDSASTTNTSDTTDSTSTTDTSNTTGTTSTTDTTSTSNGTKNSVPKLPGKITSGSSGTSTPKKGNSTSKKSSGLKSPLASLLPQTGEKGGWILTFVGVVILGVVGWFVFKKKR